MQIKDMDPEDLLGKHIPFSGGIRLESILGYGSFATVYKAVSKDGKVYAVKWLNKIGMSEKEQALQKDEVMYMKMLGDHKNIIRLYDVIETSDSLYLILECCTTDLYELITQSEEQLEIPRVKRYFNEICDGVKHCHNNHIYHRDLKPENILLSDDDHCKISDFGLCCFDEWTNDFNCGSLRYMSPECIENEESYDDEDEYDDDDYDDYDENYYGGRRKNERDGLECNSKGSDVWALGVILINMIFGQNPWSSADMENPTFNMFIRKDANVLQRKLGLSDEFNRVVKRMFSKNVYDRYSLDELRAEVNRIEVFTDFSKRVNNYLGVDEEYTNSSDMTYDEEKGEDNDSQYDNVDDYDDWYQENIYEDQHDHVVVPDIDTLELGNEKSQDQEEQEPFDYSFNYKSNIPIIGSWGDDIDDEDMATELTPRVMDRDEEEEEDYTSKMMTSTDPTYDDSDIPMSWENRNDTNDSATIKETNHGSDEWNKVVPVKKSPLDTSKEWKKEDYAYTKDKMNEWKKEEEEDQMESEECLTTPTVEEFHSFNQKKLFEMAARKNASGSNDKPSLSKKKSIQLRWEDLFDSDEDHKNEGDRQSTLTDTTTSQKNDENRSKDRFQISEQALPSSWNYQQGLSWGDMMDDDDDFMPSKPQPEVVLAQPPPLVSTNDKPKQKPKQIKTTFAENEDLFKKERVPVSSEVSSVVTPSLLTNGMQKKIKEFAKKNHKEKKHSSTKSKRKSSKEATTSHSSLVKDKETRRHHKSKKESKDSKGVDAIKIKSSKHKHHHSHNKSGITEKSLGKEKGKSTKNQHKSNKNKIDSTQPSNDSLNHSQEPLSSVNHTPSSSTEPHRKNKSKNKNKKGSKHHKHDRKSSTSSKPKNSSSLAVPPTSVQLDWEDLFSSDGEEKTTTKTESIKTNDKSFSIEEAMEAEDEIFNLSNNIKALDIDNEKGHQKVSSTVNKMVDSAISVSETNLSKEIKNLIFH